MDRGCNSDPGPVSPPSIRLFTLVMSIAVFVAVLAVPRSARACTITSPYPQLANNADGIAIAFVGRQIDRILDDPRLTLVFEVDRVYKGHIGPVVEVQTISSSCGTNFSHSGTTAVVAKLAEQDSHWGDLKAGDLYVTYVETFYSIADLEEVFGAGYPPDPTIQLPEPQSSEPQISEPQISERSGNPTSIRQTVASGIALIVLGAGLIAIRRRRRHEGR